MLTFPEHTFTFSYFSGKVLDGPFPKNGVTIVPPPQKEISERQVLHNHFRGTVHYFVFCICSILHTCCIGILSWLLNKLRQLWQLPEVGCRRNWSRWHILRSLLHSMLFSHLFDFFHCVPILCVAQPLLHLIVLLFSTVFYSLCPEDQYVCLDSPERAQFTFTFLFLLSCEFWDLFVVVPTVCQFVSLSPSNFVVKRPTDPLSIIVSRLQGNKAWLIESCWPYHYCTCTGGNGHQCNLHIPANKLPEASQVRMKMRRDNGGGGVFKCLLKLPAWEEV